MLKSIKRSGLFVIPFLISVLVVTIILATCSKADIHLAVNRMNNPFFDSFFAYATWFGDGTMVILIGLIFLFVDFRKFFIIIVSFLLSGLLVQILKRLIFVNSIRPTRYFQGIAELHLVDGIKMYNDHSFPSGHSASAFAFFFSLALFSGNRLIQVLCFIAAVLIAYSRMYLSQHFLLDIYAGSILGFVVALVCYYWFNQMNKDWLNRNIQYVMKKKSV